MILQMYGSNIYGYDSCAQRTAIVEDNKSLISLTNNESFRSKLEIGFNMESVPFERTFWDTNKGDVSEVISEKLVNMPGVVLRYPGGSVSNRFDYYGAMSETRSVQSLVNWAEPAQVNFGPAEYVDFTLKINAQAWFVVNVLGNEKNHLNAFLLARSNVDLLKTILKTTSILGVELGNELYMPRHNISGGEYAAKILPTIELLKEEIPDIRIVVGLAGFNIGKMRASEFNYDLIKGLNSADLEFSIHYYYDGPPGGPPIKSALRDLCKTIESLNKLGYNSPRIWLSEHGRWPGGKVSDSAWNKLWPNSYSLGAALSIAEFTIAAAQIPEVQGIFLHAMSSGGPWPMFHITGDKSAPESSVTFLAQTLLHNLSHGEILSSSVLTPVIKDTPLIRAVFFRVNKTETRLLIVHRGKKSQEFTIKVPHFASKNIDYTMDVLTGASPDLNNTLKGVERLKIVQLKDRVTFSSDGISKIRLPMLSVSQITFTEVVID